jgi:hypothetical protein
MVTAYRMLAVRSRGNQESGGCITFIVVIIIIIIIIIIITIIFGNKHLSSFPRSNSKLTQKLWLS